jgi:hypothetical protein
MAKTGLVRGRHYTTFTDEVRQLKREGKTEAAERLLLELVAATEEEARAEGWGVAPWYYEQLAILYAKRQDSQQELAILERYDGQRHAPGAGPSKLSARLQKLRGRLNKGA